MRRKGWGGKDWFRGVGGCIDEVCLGVGDTVGIEEHDLTTYENSKFR